jgi:cytidine deaminase
MPSTHPQAHLDPELFKLCVDAFIHIPASDDNHTVAAAVRSLTGQTFVALNVYHFTGGPCAELSVLGAAAAGGVLAPDIDTIVAVCRRGERGDVFRVINPCGRCSQTMLDYNPGIGVVVLDREGREVRVRVRDLMVYPSVWEDGNTGREEKRKALEAGLEMEGS